MGIFSAKFVHSLMLLIVLNFVTSSFDANADQFEQCFPEVVKSEYHSIAQNISAVVEVRMNRRDCYEEGRIEQLTVWVNGDERVVVFEELFRERFGLVHFDAYLDGDSVTLIFESSLREDYYIWVGGDGVVTR